MFENSLVIAYYPPAVLRNALAIGGPGSLQPSELHITLAYLGEEGYVDPDAVAALPNALKNFWDLAAPARIGGVGRFYNAEGDLDAVYASVDSRSLHETHSRLESTLANVGIFSQSNHGFTPHITLAYVDSNAPTPQIPRDLIGAEFMVNTLSLVVGDERRDFVYDTETQTVMLSEPVVEGDGELTGPIFVHSDKAKRRPRMRQIAEAAVLVPGEPDFDGDVLTAEKVEQVAHEWMASYRNIDLQHTLNNLDAAPVESYITKEARDVVTLEGETLHLPVGTWVMAAKFNDASAWAGIESGKYTGYSIMGVPNAAFKSDLAPKPRRTTLKDLGENWVAPFISLVDKPAVPKAKFYALKSTDDSIETNNKPDSSEEFVELSQSQLAEIVDQLKTALKSDNAGINNEDDNDPDNDVKEEPTGDVHDAPGGETVVDDPDPEAPSRAARNPEDTPGEEVDNTSDDEHEPVQENVRHNPARGESHTDSSVTVMENNPERTTSAETKHDGEVEEGELQAAKPAGQNSELFAQKEAELQALRAEYEAFKSDVERRLPRAARKSIVGQDNDANVTSSDPALVSDYDLSGRRRRG